MDTKKTDKRAPEWVNDGLIYGIVVQVVCASGEPKGDDPDFREIIPAVGESERLVMTCPYTISMSMISYVGVPVGPDEFDLTNESAERIETYKDDLHIMKYGRLKVPASLRAILAEELSKVGVRDNIDSLTGIVADNLALYKIQRDV